MNDIQAPPPSSSYVARHRAIFRRYFGPFTQHACYFCGGSLGERSWPLNSAATIVHHQDGDKTNNHPLNLKPAHHGCHTAWHAQRPGVEARSKMSEAGRMGALRRWGQDRDKALGAMATPEYAAKMAEAQRRKWQDPEERAKRLAGLRAVARTPAFRAKAAKIGDANPFYGKTHSEEARAKMRAGQASGPRASCVLCHKTLALCNVDRHVKACRRARPVASEKFSSQGFTNVSPGVIV